MGIVFRQRIGYGQRIVFRQRTGSVANHSSLLSLVLMLWMAWPQAASAQIQLDRFYPPVVTVGVQSSVVAEGKFPQWPPKVFCDLPDVKVTALKDSGKLTVEVAADASPGTAWIRFYDDGSATNLIPLLIAPVVTVSETEPNDKRSDANPVTLPAVIAGRLAKGGDSDSFKVTVKAGQRLVASVTANQVLKSPMDCVLQLADLRGNVLFQSDDVRGLDPQIVYTADADQELLVRVFAFPETPNSTVGFGGSATFVYSIDITTGPYLDHVAGSAESIVPFGYNLGDGSSGTSVKSTLVSPAVAFVPGAMGWTWRSAVDPSTQQVLPGAEFDGNLPALLYGHIEKPGEIHHYAFTAAKGTKYRAEVVSKSDGFLLDSTLTVTDQKSGNLIATNDDASRSDYDAAVDFTPKEDGIVDVAISDMLEGFGPRHFYQLQIRSAEPHCRLSVAADHLVVKRDEPYEVAIKIDRIFGFNEKIRITATDLPAGISAESVVSEPKGDTSKSVKLKLTADENALGHGSFKVAGTVLGADDQPAGGKYDATFTLRPSVSITEFWITVPPASTDKAKP